MSESDTFDSKTERLCAELAALTRKLEDQAHVNQRRQHLALFLGATLVVLVIVALSGVTKLARSLDSRALAEIGRVEVEKRLPDGRQAVQDYLHQESPRLVGDALRSVLTMVPRLRELLVQDLTQKLDAINAEFEQRLVARMTDAVHITKTKLEKNWPDATDEQKLAKLVEAVARDFETNVNAATAELYPAYSGEMNRVISYLEDLSQRKSEELTPEEQQRKEIIETLLRLILRERDGK